MARTSGAIGGASLSSLRRLAVYPHRRLPHVVTALGDSRIAAIFADAAQRNYNGASPLNWANALIGQRLIVETCFGVSGERTDQMLARLAGAIATGAGLLYLQGGLNDIGQGFPTLASSGATAFANLKAMAEAARAAGMIVVIECETGSNTIGPTRAPQVHELNARLYEYAERTPGIHLHDARPVVLDPAYAEADIRFRDGYVYDGVHPNTRGGFRWGESLAALLERLVPPRPTLLVANRNEAYDAGIRRQLLANPLFTAASGGALVNGATGTVPGSWSVRQNGSASVAVSVGANEAGPGNAATLACTFNATTTPGNDWVRLSQDVVPLDRWNAGELFEAQAMIAVTGTVAGLSGVRLQLQCNTTPTGTQDSMALVSSSFGGVPWAGPDKPYRATLRTRPYRVPALATKGWLTAAVFVEAAGAGSATVAVGQFGVRRRDAA